MKPKINILLFVIVMLGISSCDVFNTMRFGVLPDQHDFSHFPQRKIENQPPVFNFIKSDKDYNLGKLICLTNKSLNPSNVALDSFVKLHNTILFLIIRNDTILY